MENIKDLKARAYDCIANIELFQRELQSINKKIEELIESEKINN